ncbi:DUF2971 domain-containing protein [Solibacillus silvestris]
MGIDFEQWQRRIASRSDLTGRLTHLTRPQIEINEGMSFEEINILAVDNLIKILQDQKINGSSQKGFIIGLNKAVCFQDVPLYALAQNVEHERFRRDSGEDNKLRYCGVGLSFVKLNIYHNYNGRPVIYEAKRKAKELLHEDEWWRIVNYDFKREDNKWDIVDWTHEREWRVPGDMTFEFNTGFVQVILYDPDCVRYFLQKCPAEIIDKLYGFTTLKTILM